MPLALGYELLGLVSIKSPVSGLASHLPAPMELAVLRHTQGFLPVYNKANLQSKGIWEMVFSPFDRTSDFMLR